MNNKNLELLMEWNNIESFLLKEECAYLVSFKEETPAFISKIKEAGKRLVEWFKNAFNNFKTQYNEFKTNKKINMYERVLDKYKNDPNYKDRYKVFKIEVYDMDKLISIRKKGLEASTEEEVNEIKKQINEVIAKKKIEVVTINTLQKISHQAKSARSVIEMTLSLIGGSCKDGISQATKLSNTNSVDEAGKLKTALQKLKTVVMNGMYLLGVALRILLGTIRELFVQETYKNGLGQRVSVNHVLA